jgi:Cys-tRNA(Pro)/Cys-tRNA(Cys) deacylase
MRALHTSRRICVSAYDSSVEKTHAMRVLDARGTSYEATAYDASGAFHSAADAASLLGVDATTVYKTLVVLRDASSRAKPLLVMAPAASQIDLKVLARSMGEKRLRMATQREAEKLTGMQAGGISALGLRTPSRFDVVIDEAARAIATLHVSAGLRGIDLAVRTDDLVAATNARYVRVS